MFCIIVINCFLRRTMAWNLGECAVQDRRRDPRLKNFYVTHSSPNPSDWIIIKLKLNSIYSHQSTEGLDLNITLGSGSHRNDGALLLRSFSSNVALSAANSLCPHLNRIDNIRVEIEHRNSSIFDRNFRIDDENRQNVGERISKLEKRINQWDKLISRLGDRLRSVELHQRGCKVKIYIYYNKLKGSKLQIQK